LSAGTASFEVFVPLLAGSPGFWGVGEPGGANAGFEPLEQPRRSDKERSSINRERMSAFE